VEHKGIVERAVVFFLQQARRRYVKPFDKLNHVFDECSTPEAECEKIQIILLLLSGKACAAPLSVEGLLTMQEPTGQTRNARIAVRLSREEQHQVEQAAKTRGYANSSVFIRAAIRNELNGRTELNGIEERIAGACDRISRDVFRVGRGQQAFYALFDAFAKVVLTCVPEPPPDARAQAIARAKERYDRLVKSAGENMSGDARAAMQDLGHATN
jgi:Arc/MetJ-type ribon-helix-helix transcriptional regulator